MPGESKKAIKMIAVIEILIAIGITSFWGYWESVEIGVSIDCMRFPLFLTAHSAFVFLPTADCFVAYLE